MARQIILLGDGDSAQMLIETPAENEAQLQNLIKDHPELVPIDELRMTGPMMVVGRETALPSGAIDLVGLARSGELLLIEFKTGPQNTDFRQVIAQLLDYGSDLWQMPFNDFQATVARRYFGGTRCKDT